MSTYNVYCDESGHLENDELNVMVLGAVWCPLEESQGISKRIREIKQKHGMAPDFEIKWTKVSPGQAGLYLDVIDYFFDDDDLHFRAVVVLDKSKLRHEEHNQDHDTWYYKMYFTMLKTVLDPDSCYRIYIDIKDTRGEAKVRKLHDVLSNNMLDFERRIIENVQTVRSHEVEVLQICDLMIGAVSYRNRGAGGSEAKLALVHRIQERSRYELDRSTLLRASKVNLLRWVPADEALGDADQT